MHSTAQHSTAQHSTAQHSKAQHSTAQHSTAQHTSRSSTHHRPGHIRGWLRAAAVRGGPRQLGAEESENAQGLAEHKDDQHPLQHHCRVEGLAAGHEGADQPEEEQPKACGSVRGQGEVQGMGRLGSRHVRTAPPQAQLLCAHMWSQRGLGCHGSSTTVQPAPAIPPACSCSTPDLTSIHQPLRNGINIQVGQRFKPQIMQGGVVYWQRRVHVVCRPGAVGAHVQAGWGRWRLVQLRSSGSQAGAQAGRRAGRQAGRQVGRQCNLRVWHPQLLTCHAGEDGMDVLEYKAGDNHPQARPQERPLDPEFGPAAAPQPAGAEAQPPEESCAMHRGGMHRRGMTASFSPGRAAGAETRPCWRRRRRLRRCGGGGGGSRSSSHLAAAVLARLSPRRPRY